MLYTYTINFHFVLFITQTVYTISTRLNHASPPPHSTTDLGKYSISEYKALAYSFKQLCIPGDMS